MSRATRVVLLCALTSIAVQGGACATSGPDPQLADVVYVGGADEPALEQLVAAPPDADAAKGVVIDDPPNDSILNAATVVTFRWHAPAGTARGAPLLLPSPGDAGGAPRWLRDLLGPERVAHADTSTMSGAGYFLTFGTDLKSEVLRVFTTGTSYTPDAKAWATLSASMIWTRLSIVSAVFQDDQIVSGEGPFEGTPVFFCLDKDPGGT
jgi:hypothetical protein